MVKDCMKRHLHVLIGGLSSRNQDTAQDLLRTGLMMSGDVDHRVPPIFRRF
jgi:hypothetical protein